MRRIFNILSAVSLVLCLAVGVCWVRSYWRFDTLIWTKGTRYLAVQSREGYFVFLQQPNGTVQGWRFSDQPLTKRGISKVVNSLGFRTHAGIMTSKGLVRDAIVPMWFPTLVLAIGSIGIVRKVFGAGAHPAGHCRKCGYDLRASEGRCPECGTEMTRAMAIGS